MASHSPLGKAGFGRFLEARAVGDTVRTRVRSLTSIWRNINEETAKKESHRTWQKACENETFLWFLDYILIPKYIKFLRQKKGVDVKSASD